MSPLNRELPFVDEHAITIAASREVVWAALQHYALTSLRIPEGNPIARILGTEPRAGFEVSDSAPLERLTLVGRHRFSRYMLTFELTDDTDGADGQLRLRALTHAAFPGARGQVYRALVIGTRAHVVATHRMLRSVRRLSIDRQ
ncbi:MAG: hypothetical protein ACXV3C_10070 [Actinomycetes bacterium]